MLTIGCHLSSSKGYLKMGEDAISIGANTFQFFSRNPRGGSVKALDLDDIKKYRDFAKIHGINTLLVHAPYTLNACSKDEGLRDFAYRVMTEDLERLEYLPGNFYNFHPGSHVKQGVEIGIELIANLLNKVLTKEQNTTVLLETMAGKGTEIGRTFEEIQFIIEKVDLQEKLGVCLDTCHVFDAGYDIVSDLDGVLKSFDEIIGLDRLKAIHLNDSMNAISSHKDRHAKIGEGNIGLDAIVNVMNHPLLKKLPFFLETPNELDGYAKEIELLKSKYLK